MRNQLLAEIFTRLAKIYAIRGDPNDFFRIRSYERAAAAVKELPQDIGDLALGGNLEKIPGIGQHIADKIKDYLKTGKIKQYEELKKKYPEKLLNLLEIQSLGPKKLKILHDQAGVSDLQSLEKAIKSGRAGKLNTFGSKTVQNILQGIERLKQKKQRSLLGEVYLEVQELIKYMEQCSEVKQVEAAGSFRRRQETIGDIDLLAAGKNHTRIIQHFTQHPEVKKILAQGKTKGTVILNSGKQIDLRVVDQKEWGSAWQYFTGSKQHNIHLRTISKEQGIKINEYGAFKGEKRIAGETEEGIYQALGMQWIPPEMREDRGEIELARQFHLPKLIDLMDIKGDFHVHSNYSDGRNTIAEMAVAAEERGYEYLVITDHSQSLKVARGLTKTDLKTKKAEIDQLTQKFKIKILFGTEVDILADGSIDYENEVLKEFDFVIAAIHTRFSQDNTERILRAMDNPYVCAIGHLSGRWIGMREAYPLDYDRIFAKAAQTKTLIEINAQPVRLDLRDIYMRKAKEYGVMFYIGTDAHTINDLWLMELGVATARRGWLGKEDIMNARGWEEVARRGG
jgi:DNA polymerase (family 10)